MANSILIMRRKTYRIRYQDINHLSTDANTARKLQFTGSQIAGNKVSFLPICGMTLQHWIYYSAPIWMKVVQWAFSNQNNFIQCPSAWCWMALEIWRHSSFCINKHHSVHPMIQRSVTYAGVYCNSVPEKHRTMKLGKNISHEKYQKTIFFF